MNKHYVIDPNGKTHTRNSKTRLYSHCVLGRRTNASLINGCAIDIRYQERQVRKYSDPVEIEKICAEWKRMFGDSYEKTEERCKGWLENAQRNLERCRKTLAEYREKSERGELIEPDWGSLGWSSRLDLAQKVADKHRADHEVLVIQAEMK